MGRPHGVAGELYVASLSLDAAELKTVGAVEWRGRGGAVRPLRVASVRAAHERLLVMFGGIPNREAAAELTNGELWVDPARLPDPGPGVVYTYQLVGLRVVTPEGRELGVVREVSMVAGRPLYLIRGDRERLLPGHEPFLKHVDLAGGVITLDPPRGFEELDA